jgi:hypothetical protein
MPKTMNPARAIGADGPGAEELGELSSRPTTHQVHLKKAILGM